jgi:hypothetical protein
MPAAYSDHPDGLIAALVARTEGCCMFCEEPLVRKGKGRPNTDTCGGLECVRAWQRAWKRDMRRHVAAAKPWPPDWMRRGAR